MTTREPRSFIRSHTCIHAAIRDIIYNTTADYLMDLLLPV